MNSTFHQIHNKRIHQRHQKQLRTLFVENPSTLLNFSSTDFLNLLKHPFVKERAIDYAIEWGNGCYSFRHLEEYKQKHTETERSLSELIGMPETLLFQSHPHLLSSLVQSLILPKTLVLKSDSFSLSFKSSALIQPFQTDRIDHLKYLLQTASNSKKYSNTLILLDSLCTAKPSAPSLKEFAEIAKANRATFIVDDTQTIGMLGKHGMGLSAGLSGADLIFGSFGKGFGSYASYVSSTQELLHYMGYQNPTLQTLSPLPPFLLGLVDASLSLIPSMSMERNHLLSRAKQLRLQIKRGPYIIKDCLSHTLSLLFNHPTERATFKNYLTDHQCLSFLPPAPLQLDFFLTTQHTEQDLNKFLTIIKSYRPPFKYEKG